MKDIKHIRRDFHSAPGSCPRGGTWGYRGVLGGPIFFPKFNQIWCVSYLHKWQMQRHNCFGPRPLGPLGGAIRSNIIKSQSQSQVQRFLNQTLCVFSQMKDIKPIRQDYHSDVKVMPQGWVLGAPRGLGDEKKSRNSTGFGV